jgi:hypothetical protein
MDAAKVGAYLKTLKKDRKIGQHLLTCQEGRLILHHTTTDFKAEVGEHPMPKEVTYPDWEHIIPNPREKANGKFGINLNYVLEFGKYLWSVVGNYQVEVRYASAEELGPVLFTPDSPLLEGNVEYIVMPVRL